MLSNVDFEKKLHKIKNINNHANFKNQGQPFSFQKKIYFRDPKIKIKF